MTMIEPDPFPGLVDLAAERLGGRTLIANDEFFAPKENLLKPGRGIFIPDKYTENGKWMDGWETRRRRTPGHDWCIVRLGLAGKIQWITIDTNNFQFNSPSHAWVDACAQEADALADHLVNNTIKWKEILSKSPVVPHSENRFQIADEHCYTHVRLNIFPDGGVARLRLHGEVIPDWRRIGESDLVDLAALENGGLAVASSDTSFGPMQNLILPGRALNMGDGWETKRRRGPGHDWVILKLGRPGRVRSIEVDTNHFKGNYPDECSIEGCFSPDAPASSLTSAEIRWYELLPKAKLQGHTQHLFCKELNEAGPSTHIRLNIYPDGGVSRLRIWGTLLA